MATARTGGALAVLAALALAPVAALANTQLHRSQGPLSVTFTPPPTHTPKINTNIPIAVSATLSAKPARGASAKYVFLFGGIPVSTQYPRNNKHFTFNGSFKDTLVFPAPSIGQPLTLRFVIAAGGHSVSLDWAITAHR